MKYLWVVVSVRGNLEGFRNSKVCLESSHVTRDSAKKRCEEERRIFHRKHPEIAGDPFLIRRLCIPEFVLESLLKIKTNEQATSILNKISKEMEKTNL